MGESGEERAPFKELGCCEGVSCEQCYLEDYQLYYHCYTEKPAAKCVKSLTLYQIGEKVDAGTPGADPCEGCAFIQDCALKNTRSRSTL
jgi:hypothetical protein